MCGLSGELRFDGETPDLKNLQKINDCMVARGPDDAGFFQHGPLAFGHRRLKIMDMSDGSRQPMIDEDLGLALVFNGAIYNYPELKKELLAKGYSFQSDGDTEVLLKAWHAWGEKCLQKFYGMFAFAVYDLKKEALFLARDRLGIKPLYYTQDKNRIRFCSSLPALLKGGDVDTSVDPVALHHYLSWHAVVPAPRTILQGVRKLPPATIMTIDAEGNAKQKTYWNVDYTPVEGVGETEWRDRLGDALRRSVARRMVADVPVGVLLSGGVDSSLIVGLLAEAGQQNLATFSIGFESVNGEKGDEFEYSDVIAKHFGTNHHQIFIETGEALENLSGCIGAMNEPMVSHDNIGFYLLSCEVAKHIRVVQSGQGADEVFGGYHWYPPMMGAEDAPETYRKNFFDRDHEDMCKLVSAEWQTDDVSGEFVRAHFAMRGADLPVNKALRLDTHVMLVDDPVKRVDSQTMAWSLEARVPFLDHDVVELAAQMPPDLKVRGEGKYILKEVARTVIPPKVIDRPKGYFPMPAFKYLQGEVLAHVQAVLYSKAAKERNLFKADYVNHLLLAPEVAENITPLGGSKLWQIAMLESWLQEHVK